MRRLAYGRPPGEERSVRRIRRRRQSTRQWATGRTRRCLGPRRTPRRRTRQRDRPERRQHLTPPASARRSRTRRDPPRRKPRSTTNSRPAMSSSCGRSCVRLPAPISTTSTSSLRTTSGTAASLEEISRDELARRLDDGTLIVIDVRPEAEYAAGTHPRRPLRPDRSTLRHRPWPADRCRSRRLLPRPVLRVRRRRRPTPAPTPPQRPTPPRRIPRMAHRPTPHRNGTRILTLERVAQAK